MAVNGCNREMNKQFRQLYKFCTGLSFVRVKFCVLLTLTFLQGTLAADMNCASVRYTYEEKGVSVGQVPKDPLSGGHLTVCPQGPTCCTQEMETRLQQQSLREFDRAVKDSLSKLAGLLRTRATRFDEFFKKLLTQSKRDFHEMFKRTYGIIYEQHSYVFTDLFEELERYYARGNVALADALDNFFSVLYQKMFTVLNAQYQFEETYLRCVSEHMEELKPFGDVPHKLSIQLKRSFVATRTFAQALSVASDVVNNMVMIAPSQDCIRALTKMTGCPACQGLPELKACNNYCINVMKGCLAYHSELETDWNTFVDIMDKVAERLLGPFNIEMVVEPIDIKISEAIMNFQENGHEISQRVFSGCGKPLLGRRRRRDASELSFDTFNMGTDSDNLDDDDDDGGSGSAKLTKLIKDIKSKVQDSKMFWSHLPYQICNNDAVAASPAKEDSCWNGAMKARYEPQIIGDGISNQQSNPEVNVDVSHPSSLLNEQMFTLRLITSKLKSAFNGLDVDWMDMDPEDVSSGAGSGSGDGNTELEDDTEDGDVDEGSGDFDYGRGGSGGRPGGAGGGPYRPQGGDDIGRGATGPDRQRPKNTTSGSNGHIREPVISVTRAVTSYLLPIVVMWFGGIFSDWL